MPNPPVSSARRFRTRCRNQRRQPVKTQPGDQSGSAARPPTVFNPDPNPLILPTNLPPATNWSHKVLIHSNAPAAAPLQFNPDPGAGLRPPVAAPPPPFFS